MPLVSSLARPQALLLTMLLIAGDSAALTLTPGSAWPQREIPVCWDEMRPEHRQERDLIRKVVASSWERESALRFTGWRRCQEGADGIRISLDAQYPQTAGRGKHLNGAPRGVQLTSLWSLAALSINAKAPVHEFGHALGFGHEYARSDQPDPETCSLRLGSGRLYTEDDTPLTPFDHDSIMVGCVAGATVRFSKGLPKLSALDIFGLVRIYGSNPENVLGTDGDGNRFGAAILVEDFDGNGVLDLAVGAPGKHGGAGAVFLYRGDRVSGFRPWAALSAAASETGAEGLGTSLAWRPAGPDTPAGIVAGDATGQLYDVTTPARTMPGIAPRNGAAPVPEPRVVRRTLPEIDVIAGFGFPPLDAPADVVAADLDADGTMELVVGLPQARIAGVQSGAVVVVQHDPTPSQAHRRVAWYWFGQSY